MGLSPGMIAKVLVVSALMTLASGTAAFADVVTNTLDGTPDDAVEEITLAEGDRTTQHVRFEVLKRDGDGEFGCNFNNWLGVPDANRYLKAKITPNTLSDFTWNWLAEIGGLGTGASFAGSPYLMFQECGPNNPIATVEIRPKGVAGSTFIDLTEFANTTPGSFDLRASGFRFTVRNVPPTANDDTFAFPEDGHALAFPVLGNDTDPGGTAGVTVKSVSQPSHGRVWINPADPRLVFYQSEEQNFSGMDSFTYTAADRSGATDTATVNVRVTPVNDAPRADDEHFSVGGIGLRLEAPGVLENDSDVEGNPLTAHKVTDPAHGSVTLNPDGSFYYAVEPGYVGPDSFTYKASDGTGESNTATVSFSVEDVFMPTVKSVGPTGKKVSPAANVYATFSEAMDPETVRGKTFTLKKRGSAKAVPATVRYDAAAKKATLNPSRWLVRGATYRARVSSDTTDLAGNWILKDKTWSFTVRR